MPNGVLFALEARQVAALFQQLLHRNRFAFEQFVIDEGLQHAGRLCQLRIEQFLDLMARVQIAARQRHGPHQCNDQQQGEQQALADGRHGRCRSMT